MDEEKSAGPARRIKLTVEYNGTRYGGFQRQKNAPTIQGELERALYALTGEEIAVVGAGRTDAGVHALGQVVHFDTDSLLPIERFPRALNAHLPPDIAVRRGEEVPLSFHARKSAKGKRYVYRIFNDPERPALFADTLWHIREPLDDQAMDEAVRYLIGTHDFCSFRASGSSVMGTIRTMTQAEISRSGPVLTCTFAANGFLYNMVRIIVGTLVEIGRGKLPAEEMAAILAAKDRGVAGPTAPPQGLVLEEVYY